MNSLIPELEASSSESSVEVAVSDCNRDVQSRGHQLNLIANPVRDPNESGDVKFSTVHSTAKSASQYISSPAS